MDLGTILGVWAHPDDEAYLSGGIMAQSVHDGRRVVCVTATRGEAGSWDHARWPPEELGAIREAELNDSLTILGVDEHHWLDYPDGGCAEVDPVEATAKISSIMQAVRPDSVLTFGPDGHTGHPDHIAVHHWTAAAFEASAQPGARLYYPCVAAGPLVELIPMFREKNIYTADTPRILPVEQLAIYFQLPRHLVELKKKALYAQISQVEPVFALFSDPEAILEAILVEEPFELGAQKT